MPPLPLTRIKHLLPFAGVLERYGEPMGRLLQMAGLPGGCLDDTEMLVTIDATSRFRELCARKSGLPNIALAATEHLGVADLGEFGHALLRAPTLHRSLSEFCRLACTQSSNLVIEMHPLPSGDLLLCHRVLSEIGKREWHRNLYDLTWMVKVVRLIDPAWSPSEIWIDSKASPERLEAIESLGSTPHFGHHYTGFVVPAPLLALPPAKSLEDRVKRNVNYDHLWSTSPSMTYAGAMQQILRSYASDGWLSVDCASEVTRTSVRTLQRRLSEEGTTFSRIVEQTRSKMAGELLEQSNATMAEISRALGYKNQGDFTRAFRRWAGVSPSEFRQGRA